MGASSQLWSQVWGNGDVGNVAKAQFVNYAWMRLGLFGCASALLFVALGP